MKVRTFPQKAGMQLHPYDHVRQPHQLCVRGSVASQVISNLPKHVVIDSLVDAQGFVVIALPGRF